VHAALKGYGVDESLRHTGAVAANARDVLWKSFPPDDFPLYFYRWPKAPDLELTEDELDLDAIRAAGVFWVTGTGLCAEPSRTATLAALRARGGRGITVLDLDYRPMFWPRGSRPGTGYNRRCLRERRGRQPGRVPDRGR